MNSEDLEKGWNRLQMIYKMPKFDHAIGREWLRVLQNFSATDLEAAISMWIATQKYRPVPVDLAHYCQKAQFKRQREAAELERQTHGTCPWCGGLGYIGQFWEPEALDKYFPCQCALSPNPEKGAAILAQAKADEAWIFDKVNHGFRRRRGWVAEQYNETPVTPAQAAMFEQMGGLVGHKMNAHR